MFHYSGNLPEATINKLGLALSKSHRWSSPRIAVRLYEIPGYNNVFLAETDQYGTPAYHHCNLLVMGSQDLKISHALLNECTKETFLSLVEKAIQGDQHLKTTNLYF